jgi:hypothetical protein
LGDESKSAHRGGKKKVDDQSVGGINQVKKRVGCCELENYKVNSKVMDTKVKMSETSAKRQACDCGSLLQVWGKQLFAGSAKATSSFSHRFSATVLSPIGLTTR